MSCETFGNFEPVPGPQDEIHEKFLGFVTQSFFACFQHLQNLNIILSEPPEELRNNSAEHPYENLELAKEMSDAIIKIIDKYQLMEVEELYSHEGTTSDDIEMSETVESHLGLNQLNNAVEGHLPASQSSGKNFLINKNVFELDRI